MEDLLPVMVSSFPPSRPLSGRLLEFFGYYWWERQRARLFQTFTPAVLELLRQTGRCGGAARLLLLMAVVFLLGWRFLTVNVSSAGEVSAVA